MSRLIANERELHDAVQTDDGVFVLFYASWCPFSQRFLSAYEDIARSLDFPCLRILNDHNEALFERYSIDVYPTVLFFKSGRVSKRLDGIYHVGLDERQMADLVASCRAQAK